MQILRIDIDVSWADGIWFETGYFGGNLFWMGWGINLLRFLLLFVSISSSVIKGPFLILKCCDISLDSLSYVELFSPYFTCGLPSIITMA